MTRHALLAGSLACAWWTAAAWNSMGFGQGKPEAKTVATIVEIAFAEQEINPPNLVITVTGEVPTGGYSNATLTRAVYIRQPEDGIQDYTLTATPPDGPAIQVISRVTAKDTWQAYRKAAPWLKGIRVHGTGEGVLVKMLPAAKS